MNNLPCVFLASLCLERADDLAAALKAQGFDVQVCTDSAEYPHAVANPALYELVVVDMPMVAGRDVELLNECAPRDVVALALLPDGLQADLPALLEGGVDLPLLGEQSPSLVASSALVLWQRAQGYFDPQAWVIDALRWTMTAPSGDGVASLTYKERELLLRLARQPGEPTAREAFADLFGATADLFDVRRLEIMVRRLRKKIRSNCGTELPLHTAHGVGFALGAQVIVRDIKDRKSNQPKV